MSTDHPTKDSLAPLQPLGLLVVNVPEHLPQKGMVAETHNMPELNMGMLFCTLRRWSIKQPQYPESKIQLNQVAKCFCRRSSYFSSETSRLAPTRNFWMDLLSASSFSSEVVIATWAASCEFHTEDLIVLLVTRQFIWLCISSMTSHAECATITGLREMNVEWKDHYYQSVTTQQVTGGNTIHH